jgi:hypothetical protein
MSNYQLANLILGETVHFSISVFLFFSAVSACIHFIDEVFTFPTIVEPVPAIVEPVPAIVEPVPAIVEPVPAIVEPVPAIVEPVPAIVEPVLAFNPPLTDSPDITLAELTIRELKAMAREKKVKNYGRMKKSELVEALT